LLEAFSINIRTYPDVIVGLYNVINTFSTYVLDKQQE